MLSVKQDGFEYDFWEFDMNRTVMEPGSPRLQTASFMIWTRLAKFTSIHDNYYATCASKTWITYVWFEMFLVNWKFTTDPSEKVIVNLED